MTAEWFDISTAPKDGSGVILIDMGAQQPEAGVGWYAFDIWTAIDPDGEPVFDEEFYRSMIWLSPTHWQPLPPPPAKEGDRG